MGVVDGRDCIWSALDKGKIVVWRLTERDWGCSSLILVAMFVKHGLEGVDIDAVLIHNSGVVSWTGCALNGCVRAKVDIIFERSGDVAINNYTRDGVAVLVCSRSDGREKARVMTLLGHNDGEFGLEYVRMVLLRFSICFDLRHCAHHLVPNL